MVGKFAWPNDCLDASGANDGSDDLRVSLPDVPLDRSATLSGLQRSILPHHWNQAPSVSRSAGVDRLGRGLDQLQPQLETVWAGGGPLHFEDALFELTRPNGNGTESAWFEYSLSALREADGTVVAVFNISPETTGRFVTQRRITQEEIALAVSEERLRLAVENADVGFWDFDIDSDTLIWSSRTKAMFGISADVPVTMDDFYGGVHPDDREATRHAFLAAADPKQRVLYDVEYRTIGKEDGLERWVAAKGRGVFDDVNRCLRVAGVVVEITARRRAEEALHELNATVEARVTQALEERENAQEALRQSQKMEAMGSLTGGVAHDFNNLLTPIIGSLDMLMRKGVGSDRERRLIDGALQSAERAKTLVQRLLAFARGQPLQPIAVDVVRLVDGMVSLLRSTLGPTITVTLDLSTDLPPAKADPNQLEMALLNLAVNARDAMSEGGELTIAARRKSVKDYNAVGVRPGHYVLLCVSDTGAGMDDATLRRATEPFFSTKGIGKGTGLGLSMVHGLAAQLGGGLSIQSVRGQGTTIELYLPISFVLAGNEEERHAPAQVVEARGTALLVDDEELVRMSTAGMLEDLGYEVVETSSAFEALQLLDAGLEPSIVVTDHLMPGMTGAQLANALKADRPHLPILIISGYAESEGIDPALPD